MSAPTDSSTTAAWPTREEIIQSGQICTPSVDFTRLRWFLRGSVSDSINVVQDAFDSASSQEPYKSGDRIHAVSALPATEPPVSALEISVRILDHYHYDWLDIHERHAEPGHAGVQYDSNERVRRCCGQDRPGPGPTLSIAADYGQFVGIGLFIEAVHPWISGLERQIRLAKGVAFALSLDSSQELFLYPGKVGALFIGNSDQLAMTYSWDSLDDYVRKIEARRAARESRLTASS